MQVIIKVDTSEVDKELSDLAKRLQNKTAILRSVAEEIQESVKDRIRKGGPAPDGTPWAPLSPAYLLRKKGKGILRESDILLNTLHWQFVGDSAVAVGSPLNYAAVHQLGHTFRRTQRPKKKPKTGSVYFKAKASRKKGDIKLNFGGYSITIPARPYLGISSDDEKTIQDILKSYLEGTKR